MFCATSAGFSLSNVQGTISSLLASSPTLCATCAVVCQHESVWCAEACVLSHSLPIQWATTTTTTTGYYNDQLRPNTTTPCTACPSTLTTAQPGGRSLDDCSVCAPGRSGSNCTTQCGGAGNPTYGPPQRSAGSACEQCPVMATGFSFDYLGTTYTYAPSSVARAGAESPADCLAEFAQIVDTAWYLGGSVSLTNVSGATTFAACVSNCSADSQCQYFTFDHETSARFKKTASSNVTR